MHFMNFCITIFVLLSPMIEQENTQFMIFVDLYNTDISSFISVI